MFDIPENWKLSQLSELALIGSGESLPQHCRGATYPIMGANGVIGSAASYNFDNGYLVGRVGAAGAVSRLLDKCWASDNTLTVIPHSQRVNERFLGWLLDYLKLERLATKTAQPLITQSQLKQLPIIVPVEKSEQESIADILDTIDTQIQKTEAIIAKLQQVKQGLLRDLLSRGVDATGQLRPPHEQAPELYKESPFGWIPKEWAVQPIDQLGAWVTSGSRDWAQFYSEQGDIFVRIGNLTREHINLRLDNLQHVTPPVTADGQRTRLVAGDVLISITADLGIIGVIPKGFGDAYINQHIALVRFPRTTMEPRFAGHFLGSVIFQGRVSQFNDAGAKSGLNLPTVRGFEVIVPTLDEQVEIMKRLDTCDAKIASEKEVAKKLKLKKSGLMDDLLTGRVRVHQLMS